MRPAILLSIGILAIPTEAYTEDCRTIQEPAARLACFDKVAGPAKPSPKKKSTAATIDDIAMAKRAVVRTLKDPNSALFGDVYRGPGEPGYAIVCGGVNAKNSYGGYGGMTPFVWYPDKDEAVLLSVSGATQETVLGMEAYKYNCRDNPKALLK